MIVGMHIIDDFKVEDSEELVKELRERNLIDFTLEEVKELVSKEYNGADFEDVQLEDDCLNYILEDLAKGNYFWEYHEEDKEMFTIYVIDTKDPFTIDGHVPDNKVKVNFD